MSASSTNRRILIIDDTPSVREDFQKILGMRTHPGVAPDVAQALFGTTEAPAEGFELTLASQGAEGLQKLEEANLAGTPFALAFVDMRMPPGWDGLETIQRLWQADPELQVVLCTAYSDHSWDEIARQLGRREQLIILKKPFEVVEVVQLSESLTQKWTLHEELRIYQAELEDKVRQRTASLELAHRHLEGEMRSRLAAHARVRQVQKLEALGRLATGLAHEINNPLTVVLSNLNWLRVELEPLRAGMSAEASAELESVMADAFVAATRVRGITKNMQRFAGPEKEALAPVDVVASMEGALTLLAPSLKHVEIRRSYDAVPPVMAEESHLLHAFTQILSNALQALPTDKARVLSVGTALAADGAVEVSIEDNGPGIPPADLEHVFEPFFTTRPVGQGVGLGLPVCHSLVRFLGGELTLDSSPGAGTRCRVRLPPAPGAAVRHGAEIRVLAQG